MIMGFKRIRILTQKGTLAKLFGMQKVGTPTPSLLQNKETKNFTMVGTKTQGAKNEMEKI